MRKLRSKLERASPDWRYIHTHFGIGYRFSAEPVEEPVARGPARRRSRVEPRWSRPSRSARRRVPDLVHAALELTSGGPGPQHAHPQLRDRPRCSPSPSGSVPGGGTGAATIENIFSVIFLGGAFFFGYRLYMEHRDTIFGLEERQRGILYGACALALFALVATSAPVARLALPRRHALDAHARRRRLGHLQRLAQLPHLLSAARKVGTQPAQFRNTYV